MSRVAKPISVLVADDHPLFRAALVDIVKRRPELELVGEAADGRSALDQVRERKPDVTVLDIRMPGLDGSQVLKAITRDLIPTRVLFLATSTDSQQVYQLIADGAAGYLDKGVSIDEIGDGIVAIARGKTVLSKAVQDGVLDQVRRRGANESPTLSPREAEVLRLIAGGLSAPQIAGRLYIEPSTVKSHSRSIYEKLGVSGRAAAVAEGMRRGLLE
jgi:two-component system nitrate/nitrite response regulator NarL